MPPCGVIVDLELGVAGNDFARLRHHEWVDLGGQRVVIGDRPVKLLDQGADRPGQLAEAGVVDELRQLEIERPSPRVRIKPRDRPRRLLRDLLDVHAAPRGQHQDVGPRVAVHREAEVDLALDVQRGLAVDEGHLEPLDVHADDLLRRLPGLVRRLRKPDPAGLAPTPDRHLGLHRDRAELGNRGGRLVGGAGDQAGRDGDAKRGENFLGLVLEKLHEGRLTLLAQAEPPVVAERPVALRILELARAEQLEPELAADGVRRGVVD